MTHIRRRVTVVAVITTAITAAFLVFAWRVAGDHGFVIAWVTHFTLMAWSFIVGIPRSGLTAPWFLVREWEPRVHRALGVRFFDRFLTIIGWNRFIAMERTFDGSRSGLAALDHDTRRSEVAHLACLAITVGIAVVALTIGSRGAAIWLTALAVPLHLYPVGVQRLLRSRIHRLTARLPAAH